MRAVQLLQTYSAFLFFLFCFSLANFSAYYSKTEPQILRQTKKKSSFLETQCSINIMSLSLSEQGRIIKCSFIIIIFIKLQSSPFIQTIFECPLYIKGHFDFDPQSVKLWILMPNVQACFQSGLPSIFYNDVAIKCQLSTKRYNFFFFLLKHRIILLQVVLNSHIATSKFILLLDPLNQFIFIFFPSSLFFNIRLSNSPNLFFFHTARQIKLECLLLFFFKVHLGTKIQYLLVVHEFH